MMFGVSMEYSESLCCANHAGKRANCPAWGSTRYCPGFGLADYHPGQATDQYLRHPTFPLPPPRPQVGMSPHWVTTLYHGEECCHPAKQGVVCEGNEKTWSSLNLWQFRFRFVGELGAIKRTSVIWTKELNMNSFSCRLATSPATYNPLLAI